MNKFLSVVMAVIAIASGIGLVICTLISSKNDTDTIVLAINFVVSTLLWRSMDKESENSEEK